MIGLKENASLVFKRSGGRRGNMAEEEKKVILTERAEALLEELGVKKEAIEEVEKPAPLPLPPAPPRRKIEPLYKIVETGTGELAIYTPYNTLFIEEIKRVPTRRWDSLKKAWIVSEEYRPDVERIVEKYFPTREEEIEDILWGIRKTAVFGGLGYAESLTVDGQRLISFTRDWVSAKDRPGIEIVYDDLYSGGSRKYPTWWGKIVIRTSIHKDVRIGNVGEKDIPIVVKGMGARDVELTGAVIDEIKLITKENPMSEQRCNTLCDRYKAKYPSTACHFVPEKLQCRILTEGEE